MAATDDYFAEQDLLAQWLDEECDAEPGNEFKWDRTTSLFENWSNYAQRAGETPGSKKAFSEALQRRGFARDKGAKGVRIFRVICKRHDPCADRVADSGR